MSIYIMTKMFAGDYVHGTKTRWSQGGPKPKGRTKRQKETLIQHSAICSQIHLAPRLTLLICLINPKSPNAKKLGGHLTGCTKVLQGVKV